MFCIHVGKCCTTLVIAAAAYRGGGARVDASVLLKIIHKIFYAESFFLFMGAISQCCGSLYLLFMGKTEEPKWSK